MVRLKIYKFMCMCLCGVLYIFELEFRNFIKMNIKNLIVILLKL